MDLKVDFDYYLQRNKKKLLKQHKKVNNNLKPKIENYKDLKKFEEELKSWEISTKNMIETLKKDGNLAISPERYLLIKKDLPNHYIKSVLEDEITMDVLIIELKEKRRK